MLLNIHKEKNTRSHLEMSTLIATSFDLHTAMQFYDLNVIAAIIYAYYFLLGHRMVS